MESSAIGRLGLKTKTHFHWKGKTFSQVSSILQKNKPNDSIKPNSQFFKALPNQIYRREIVSVENPQSGSSRGTKISTTTDIPGGTIVNTQSTLCEGIMGTANLTYDESKTALQCSPGCNSQLDNDVSQRNSKYIQTLSIQENARRRVRSSGMMRPRFKENTIQSDNYASSGQYLHSRNKTFQQNQFSNLRKGDSSAIPGTTASQDNKYASNTIQYCDSSSNLTNYVPVYYKPNNSKFAQQGAVDSGCRLTRLKYDTITSAGNSMRVAYGPSTANALAYGVPSNGYTIKDKIGYPNKCTPIFPKYGGCNVTK